MLLKEFSHENHCATVIGRYPCGIEEFDFSFEIIKLLKFKNFLYLKTLAQTSVFTLAPDFATGVRQAQREGKPILAIILRTFCGSCKKLMKDIASNSASVQKAANGVVVVQSIDESEPAIEDYGYDQYISNPYWPRFETLKLLFCVDK